MIPSIPFRWPRRALAVATAAMLMMAAASAEEPLRIDAAGSLVGPINEALAASGLQADAVARPVFGPAGLLRRRLEQGEAADLFLSADLAQPRTLAAAHPAAFVVPFARNHLCLLSKKSLGTTDDSVVAALLDPATRLATSTPAADPGGDYAWQVFARADRVRAGARAALEAKALQLLGSPNAMTPIAGKSASASVFLSDKADALLYYCSGQTETLRDVPGLQSHRLPPAIDVTATYAMAVLSDKPDALRFALFLVSEQGQALLARHGLVPLDTTE